MNDKILIISDNKPGHLNQSIAFCKLKKLKYDIVEVDTSKKMRKIFSFILDYLSIYVNLFNLKIHNEKYKAVISTGSFTYYANKYISKKLNTKSIALMLPKGFRYSDFNYILAQEHDIRESKDNIIVMPLNLSINSPMGYLKKNSSKSVGIILGGDNKLFTMRKEKIIEMLNKIYEKYPDHLKYVTTSRRTPSEIDILLDEYHFDYEVIYSKNPTINPIPDFINVCDELYISIDSTSMLSEAKANSEANIHIISLDSDRDNSKYHRLANNVKNIDGKFDYYKYLNKVKL